MKQAEKEVLARIYGCASKLTSGPNNPADRMQKAAKPLAFAISDLGFGDLDEAAIHLDEAEVLLGIAPEGESDHG